MSPEGVEALDLLPYSPVDPDGGMLSLFPVVHNQLIGLTDVEGEAVVLPPHCQVSDHLPCEVQLTLRHLWICWGDMRIRVVLGCLG